MDCLLCKQPEIPVFYTDALHKFYSCPNCFGLSRDPKSFLNPTAEQARYLTHNNNVHDPGYQQFVAPLVTAVKQKFKPNNSIGLDFGAGTGPVITKLLTDAGYKVNLYDPFFYPDKKVLALTYNFIVCCEVIEHFYNPYKEFEGLKNLLKPGGILVCKTDLFTEDLDFARWYYKNDPSHVFFYHAKTLQWIKNHFNFKDLTLKNRTSIFTA